MTVSRPHSQFPWLKARFRSVAGPWNDIGTQTKFYGARCARWAMCSPTTASS